MPHTFIDVGWWMQLFLPLPSRTKAREPFRGISHHLYNGGRARTLITDLRHVGAWVARIIADPRTLNHSVIVWEEERLHADAHEIAERYSGEAEYMRAQRIPVRTPRLSEVSYTPRADASTGRSPQRTSTNGKPKRPKRSPPTPRAPSSGRRCAFRGASTRGACTSSRRTRSRTPSSSAISTRARCTRTCPCAP